MFIWLVPIRYWEDKQPIKCKLLNKNNDSYYVYHPGYGHNVYLRLQDCFSSKKGAITEINQRNAWREKELDREAKRIIDRLIGV